MTELPNPTCADCKAFYMECQDVNGVIRGLCRLRKELGEVPENMPYCHVFHVKDSKAGLVKEVSSSKKNNRHTRSSNKASLNIEPAHRDIATLEKPVSGDTDGEIIMDKEGLKQVLRELLEEETMYGYPQISHKFSDGKMVIKPSDENLQSKEIPMEMFFHKIVMVRDRLRVLEAKLNSSKLQESEKVELQSYISKCYGSLTSFNILFSSKGDFFSSK